jgi:hypothetical protein
VGATTFSTKVPVGDADGSEAGPALGLPLVACSVKPPLGGLALVGVLLLPF